MTAAGEHDEATSPAGAPACSDAERRRAAKLARALEASGRSTRTVTLWVRPYWWAAVALCAAAGVLASVVGVDNPGCGPRGRGGRRRARRGRGHPAAAAAAPDPRPRDPERRLARHPSATDRAPSRCS